MTSKKCERVGCEEIFVLTLAAPHKRFCSGECRNRWHASRRHEGAKALAALAAAQQVADQVQGSEKNG